MTRWIVLALAGQIALLAPGVQAGESVGFSISAGGAHSVVPVTKTEVFRTEIFAIDPETGKKRLVFSDTNASVFLLPGGGLRGGIVVAARGRLFAQASEPVRTAAGTFAFDPGAPEAIYELSTDGSGKARKVFDLLSGDQRSNFRDLFLNASGTKMGNTNYIDGRPICLFMTPRRENCCGRPISGTVQWRGEAGDMVR